MQDQDKSKSREYQREMFGKKFVGATLAKISLPGESAEKIIKWLAKPRNFIVMTGPSGTGKTYFCAAMVDAILEKYEYVRSFNEGALMTKVRNFISSSSNGDYLEYMTDFCSEKLMIFDDLGASGHTDWREEVLMELVDYRYREQLPTIFTSNLSRQEFFDSYGKKIQSRLFARENIIIDISEIQDYREEGK